MRDDQADTVKILIESARVRDFLRSNSVFERFSCLFGADLMSHGRSGSQFQDAGGIFRENDPLLFFPKDNFVLKEIPVKREEGEVVRPREYKKVRKTVPKFTRFAMREISNPFVQMKRNYKDYTKIETEIFAKEYKSQKFEVDTAEEKGKKEKANRIKKKKSHVTPSVSKTRKGIKSQILPHFFYCYDSLRSEEEYNWGGGAEVKVCERRQFKEVFNLNRFVFCMGLKSLSFRYLDILGDIEPLFLSFALYDLEEQKILSETFNADLNTKEVLKQVRKGVCVISENSTLKNAVFKVNQRNPMVMLIVVLSKILETSDEEIFERITQPGKIKDLSKLKKNIGAACQKFGFLRQSIAYSPVPVFDDEENLILGNESKIMFYKTEGNQNILKMLCEEGGGERKMSGTKKIKTFQAELVLDVEEWPDFNPIHLEKNIISIKGKVKAREVREFPASPEESFNKKFSHLLYVYPEKVHFSKRGLTVKAPKHICIRVQLKRNDKKLHATDAPKSIYGLSSQEVQISTGYSKVTVGKKKPEFNDEFKIELPLNIKPEDHILFAFFNVQMTQKASKATTPLSSHGITHLPLVDEFGKLAEGRIKLEIFEVKKKEKYLSNLKKKKIGTMEVFVRPVSTIYPQEKHLARAFHNPQKCVNELANSFEVNPYYFLQNLPVIFNLIFEILSNSEDGKSLTDAFLVLLDLVEMVSKTFQSESTHRNEKLVKYVQDVFVNPSECNSCYPFFQLTHLWSSLIRDGQKKRKGTGGATTGGKALTKSLYHCWFYFEVIVRSITLYAMRDGKLTRLSDKHFNRVLTELVEVLVIEVVYRAGAGLAVAKLINQNLALFLRDLFNVLDRGLILSLINSYLRHSQRLAMKQKELIQELRMTFLSIISDYEHYVPMSLPKKKYKITTVNAERQMCDLSFLCGLIIRQAVMDVCDPERTARQRSFDLIKELLMKHEYSRLYNEKNDGEAETIISRVMGMYFPYVLYITDLFEEYKAVSMKNLNEAEAKWEEAKNRLGSTEAHYEENLLTKDMSKEGGNAALNKKLNEILSTLEKEISMLKESVSEAKSKMDEEKNRVKMEYQQMLFSVVTVLKYMDRAVLAQWFKVENKSKVVKFVKLLHDCVEFFEYRGKEEILKQEKEFGHEKMSSVKTLKEAKALLENMYVGAGGSDMLAGKKMSMRSPISPRSFGGRPTLARPGLTRKTFGMDGGGGGNTFGRGSLMKRTLRKKDEPKQIDMKAVKKVQKWEGITGSQVSFVVLDIVVDLVKVFKDERDSILSSIFDLTILYFKTNQSTKVLISFFDYLRVFLEVFRGVLFLNNTRYSELLCLELLKKCHSVVEKVRSAATGVLYLLIKNNYLEMGNFTRTKTQTTTMLSGMVSDLDERSIALLQTCFKAVAEYSKEDEKVKSSKTLRRKKTKDAGGFTEQVVALVGRLKKTLSNTKKITKYRHDPNAEEKMLTLFLSLSRSYRDAPELCVTWYNNLATFHSEKQRFVEAGQCVCVMAGYSYQYLKCKKNELMSNSILDYSLLEKCSPSLKGETFHELYSLFKEGEGPTFTSHHFTVNGFLELLEKAMKLFEHAKYYEYKVNLLKMILQYYEYIEDFPMLQRFHHDISVTYGTIHKGKNLNRMFGSYYFVGFYGKLWKKENGLEYIYKFPKISKLRDVMEYVESTFGSKFGKENVKIKPSSFEPTKEVRNDEKIAYVKIISLNPHFEEKRKVGYFHQNENIKLFMYETPFTKTGKKKSHAKQMDDQWKRKSIVEVEYMFPALTFKNKVCKTRIIELTPIENSIEIVNTSVKKLKTFKRDTKIDVNTLQLVLSGTLTPQVQEGIPAIINCFLTSKYKSDKFLPKLEQLMREFLEHSVKGLQLNEKYQSSRTAELHETFVQGYVKLYNMISGRVKGCEKWLPKKFFSV